MYIYFLSQSIKLADTLLLLRTTGRPSEMAAERPIMISKLLCISYFILHFACFVKMCSVVVFIM